MANIDDFLIQRGRVQDALRSVLDSPDFTGLFDPNLEQIQELTSGSESEVVHALFNLMLEAEPKTETLAYILLKDLDSDLAAVRARELLHHPRLTDRQHTRLDNILKSWSYELWSREIEVPIEHFDAPEIQRLLTLVSQGSLEEEELGVLWVWATRMIVPPVRMAVLETLFADPSTLALAAAWVEAAEGDPEVIVRMPHWLAKRPEVEAGELLRHLSDHRDLGIRVEADQRLRARRTLGTTDPRPLFRKALIHESPSTGIHVVAYAAEGPSGGCRVVAGIVDSWDRGLVDCWAQNRLFPEDLDVVFLLPGRLVSPSTPRELPSREAAGWLIEGEKLAARRGAELPIAWPVWRRFLRAATEPIAPRDVVFGLVCQECRNPIRREENKPIPLVLADLALCPDCLAAPGHCSNCNSPLPHRAAHAVTHPESHRIDFYCDSCHALRKRHSD